MRTTLLLAVCAALVGCGGVDAKVEDVDDRRDKAKPLPLNKVFTDSLTFSGEDRHDWKIFYIEEPGLLTVKVHFDKSDRGCVVYLKDKYGAELAKEIQSANPYVELVRRRDEASRLFVHLEADQSKCASQYSIEARLNPDP